MIKKMKRRDFLKIGAAAGTGLMIGGKGIIRAADPPAGQSVEFKVAPIETVRMGLVGVGSRGSHLLKIFLGLEGVEVRALCDIVEEKVARGQSWVEEAGQAKPEGYTKGDYDFKRLCDHDGDR